MDHRSGRCSWRLGSSGEEEEGEGEEEEGKLRTHYPLQSEREDETDSQTDEFRR